MKVISLKDKINSVLPTNLSSAIFPFITDYQANAEHYDLTFWRHYGLKDLYIDDINNASEWYALVTSVLYTYKEELQRYWDINIAEYSPIDNVTEEIITNNHIRAHEDTFKTGESKVVEATGVDGATGNSTTTTTVYEVPMDSTNEQKTGKNVSDTVNQELEVETHTDEREDSVNYGAQHERTKVMRHGNIGTTLSTDIMIGSQKYWAMFNFMNELYKLINNELFRGEWS